MYCTCRTPKVWYICARLKMKNRRHQSVWVWFHCCSISKLIIHNFVNKNQHKWLITDQHLINVGHFYSGPMGEQSGVLRSACLSVCVSVCLRAYLWNCWTNLHKMFVQIPYGRGQVLFWQLCNTLCTSGFMDDVTFGHSGPYGNAWKTEPLTY